jgi:hypothetical protein
VGAMAHVSSPRFHYEKEKITVELTGGKNRRRSGCFGPATMNGSGAALVFIEGALWLARRGIRGGNRCGGESSWSWAPFYSGRQRGEGSGMNLSYPVLR